jgi:KDO2-lipid IV(A) lauroyltransferase
VPQQEVLGTRNGPLAWLEYLSARAVLGGLARLPDGPRAALVAGLARLAKALDRRHSDAARTFLRQAFGPDLSRAELERRVLAAWRHFACVTLENAGFDRRVPPGAIGRHVELAEAHPEFLRVRAAGRGALLVTAHLGDWEAGAAALAELGFEPLYVVAKAPRNRPLSAWMQRARERRGVRVLPRRGAMQHAATILRSGGYVAMLLDQRARTRPVLAPFFGRLARCDRSAGVLMRRLRAPVVIAFCERSGPWRWTIRVQSVLQPEALAGLSPAQIAARVNREFEAAILRVPDQYFWLHDRYRDAERPPDDAPDGAPQESREAQQEAAQDGAADGRNEEAG